MPQVSLLIAAPSGIMGSALSTFARTIPGIKVVAQAYTPAEVLRNLAEQQPGILILDIDLMGEITNSRAAFLEAIQKARGAGSFVRLIVLISNPAQMQLVQSMGADKALLKGKLDDRLRQSVIQARASCIPPDPSIQE